MSFKKAHRLDTRQYTDVAGISDEQAKGAAGTGPSEMDLLNEAALDRARKVRDGSIPEVLGAKDVPARYKIEVLFQRDRTTLGPNTCKIQFWESASALHGGGDELMFICMNHHNRNEGCGAIFSQTCVKNGMALCPKCNRLVNAQLLANSLVRDASCRITTKELSARLAKLWLKLGGNADFYIKYDPDDHQPKPAHISRSGALRKNREHDKGLYPLKRIITDTSSGASLEKCIFNFMTA